ncbi:LysR family transcriptional regulator [Pseudonocardia cypriaca]|uniref:DNA-binding transcriptional LysR family regulator n=1 Tax=Pseudonocardia cypriaca TaxID=882449 RepID=A0A543GHE8_9PSEU|nr:LysR family transcriptional regulator [Pseudonocardia cypriaca]TQM45507.1 DNA-binding transcriptional LysR family regulator [Pseudonocardia cypriaca]
MEVRQLRYFVAVAEELHFGRAAERLHVAQPAVSQQVGRLERELGVRLLARTSRRVALTGDGRRLLDEARAALSAVDRVRAVAADLVAGRAAVLRVGTTPGVGPRLSRAAAKLRAEAPDLTLTLVDGTLAAHVAALRAGELDIALVRGTVAARDLQAIQVWRDPLQVMLPAAHPAAAAPTLPVTALADLTLRMPDRDSDPALHDALRAACRGAGIAPSTGRSVRSLEDAAVEIGMSSHDATVVCGCGGEPIPGVSVRPLAPPVEVPGMLLTPSSTTQTCLDGLVAALA